MKKAAILWVIALATVLFLSVDHVYSFVTQEGEKTFIVDRTGEKWDISQAVSLGLKPEKFQYGIGRKAFETLDESMLSDKTAAVDPNLRVIGISEGPLAQAYSVPKLARHEIANSVIGTDPVAVGY